MTIVSKTIHSSKLLLLHRTTLSGLDHRILTNTVTKMAGGELEEALKLVESSICHVKWRLKSFAKRRLQTDILALYSRMRPVVMIDYGGKLPELQERLCSFLSYCQKESPIFKHLRVMLIEDMIYLIHVKELSQYATSTFNSEIQLHFVNLEHEPPEITKQEDKCLPGQQLKSIQKLFTLYFPCNELDNDPSSTEGKDCLATSSMGITTSKSSEFIDLSSCMHDTQVIMPTLNGWLLGYPVVYLFGNDHIDDVVYNLSTKSLNIYRISVCRNGGSSKGSQSEELMSFSVPSDLSTRGSNEAWAVEFLGRMKSRWADCKQIWSSLQLEVNGCYQQAIVL